MKRSDRAPGKPVPVTKEGRTRVSPQGSASRRALIMCHAIALALLASGCAMVVPSIALGTATWSCRRYLDGEHTFLLQAPLEASERAVLTAAGQCHLVLVSGARGDGTAEYRFRDAEGFTFHAILERASSCGTSLRFRAGFWGDEICSYQFVAEVRRCLAHSPRA